MTGNDDPRYPVPFATTSLPGSDFAIFSRPPPHSYPLSSIGRAILPHPLCRRRASFFPIAELTICPRHRLDARFRAQLPTPSFSDTTCFFSFLSSFLFETRRGSSWASFGHVRFSRKITSYICIYCFVVFFSFERCARNEIQSIVDRYLYILLNWALCAPLRLFVIQRKFVIHLEKEMFVSERMKDKYFIVIDKL